MPDLTTVLETSVLGISILALAFSVASLFTTHTDRVVLRRLSQNGLKHLTVNARMVRDIARVCVASVLLAAALICLHAAPDYDRAALVMKVALVLIGVFLSLAVIMDYRWRRLIDKALADLENDQP